MKRLMLILGCILFAGFAPSWISAQETVLIRDVNVISMQDENEPVSVGQDVLISNSRFQSIGNSGSIDVPFGTLVVEGSGFFLIPGLADAHVHFDFGAADDNKPSQFVRENNDILRRLFIAHGVTFVRSMWGSPRIVKLRDQCNSNEILGPTIFTTGPLLSGSSVDPVRELQNDQDVAEILAEHVRLKYDALKIHSNPSLPALRLLVREAGKRKIPVYGHLPFTATAREILGIPEYRTIEHLNAMIGVCVRDEDSASGTRWPNLMKIYAQQDPAKQRNWAKLAKESGKWFCPTLLTSRVDALSPKELEHMLEQLSNQYVTNQTIDYWRNALAYEKQLYQKSGIELDSLYKAPCDILSSLIAANVKVIAGTDTPARPGVAGQVLHEELAEYVRLGMTPWQAIQSATINVADAVDQKDQFGQIMAGMRADAVLLRASPLESIGNLNAIEAVICRGNIINRKKLDALLLEIRQLVQKTNKNSK